jgi:hypothetical protein
MYTNRTGFVPLASALILLLTVPAAMVWADGLAMVVCAPGYPGSTEEAQPALDGLADAVVTVAGWESGSLEAVYFETEEGGLGRLRSPDAGLTLVTLPFFLEHRAELDLRPALLAVPSGLRALEPWTLVAGKGRIETAADLAGWQLVSLAGHSSRFVQSALAGWGRLPATVDIVFSRHVLSSLRRAAKGEQVALLLDAEQAGALDRLPFADDLEVLHISEPLPVSVFCAVGDRVAPETLDEVTAAMTNLDGSDVMSTEALSGVRLDRFEPIDRDALASFERVFDGVGE